MLQELFPKFGLNLRHRVFFLQIRHLFRDIKEGRPTKIPKYDYKSNCRVPNSFTTIRPQQVLTKKHFVATNLSLNFGFTPSVDYF